MRGVLGVASVMLVAFAADLQAQDCQLLAGTWTRPWTFATPLVLSSSERIVEYAVSDSPTAAEGERER